MSIKYFNIRSKQVAIAETEPHIAAMWASSDRSPNITQGQDFGWRLAPEVVIQLKKTRQDAGKLREIAVTYGIMPDSVGEPEILRFISDHTQSENAPVAQDGDYSDEYDQEIRRLEAIEDEKNFHATEAIPAAAPVESLADMRERAALAERIAKATSSVAEAKDAKLDAIIEDDALTTATTTTKKK